MMRYTIHLAPPISGASVVLLDVSPDGEFMRFADHTEELAQLHASREALIGALQKFLALFDAWSGTPRVALDEATLNAVDDLQVALDAARAEEK